MSKFKKILSGRPKSEWDAFRKQADADYEAEFAEELRLREEVLPFKKIPFQAKPTYDYVIERNIKIPMRDGIKLHAEVYRPEAEGTFPVLVNRGPYDCRSTLDDTPAVARCFAERGYVVICQDVRGRFGSEGEFVLNNEAEDGFDTVEWAGKQSWSNGKVGMFGISYNGLACLEAAREKSQYLKAIYPGMISYGVQESGIQQMQALGAWMLWAAYGSEGGNPLRIDLSHLPLCEIDALSGYDSDLFQIFVKNQMFAFESSPEEILSNLSEITIPTYSVTGWYDIFVDAQLDEWRQLKEMNPEARLMIGPYQHNLVEMSEMETPAIGKIPTKKTELKEYFFHMEYFFDQYLKDQKNELSENLAPVKIFVMGINEWRDEYEWPLARAVSKKLFLHSSGNAAIDLNDGVLSWEAPTEDQPTDGYEYDPLYPVHWTEDLDIWSILMTMGDRNTVQERPDVLTYSTPILNDDLEVTGPITAKIYASSSAPDTDFYVILVDVYPDGHTQYLTQGQLRARYRNGMESPQLLNAGEIVELDIVIQSTSNVFQKGHRLRIEITSSDYSRHARNQNVEDEEGVTANTAVAQNKIHHTEVHQSYIMLPIIPTQ